MSTHKSKPTIQEALEQIQEIKEALEEKPDRDDVELLSSDLEFKMEEIHDDVRGLQGEVAEVKDQVDSLEIEDR